MTENLEIPQQTQEIDTSYVVFLKTIQLFRQTIFRKFKFLLPHDFTKLQQFRYTYVDVRVSATNTL